MRARNPYSRRAKSDREPWIDRILWTREDHPLAERILIGFVALAGGAEIIFQIALQLERAAAAASHAAGP